MRGIYFLEVSFYCGGGGGALLHCRCCSGGDEVVACLEVGDAERGGFAVSARDFVHDGYGSCVVAFAHEVFGGFVEGEAEEAEEEHDQRCAALLFC